MFQRHVLGNRTNVSINTHGNLLGIFRGLQRLEDHANNLMMTLIQTTAGHCAEPDVPDGASVVQVVTKRHVRGRVNFTHLV